MDSPLGIGDIMSGGTDPTDGRSIDHTPKAVFVLGLGCLAFLYFFHEVGGFRVVVGAGTV
jgi:hypothetical protein